MNEVIIKRVSCLSCGWETTDEFSIETANAFGECIYCKEEETLLRFDYCNGDILIVNTETEERVEMKGGWDERKGL